MVESQKFVYEKKKKTFFGNEKTIVYLIYTKPYQDNNFHDQISVFAFKLFGHKPSEEKINKIKIKKSLKIEINNYYLRSVNQVFFFFGIRVLCI